jgi:fatty acid desaturase
MIRRFNEDPFFLTRYYLLWTGVSLLANGVTFFSIPHDLTPSAWIWILCLFPLIVSNFLGVIASNLFALGLVLTFHRHQIALWHLALIPLGIYLGMLNVPVIHNCAHKSFRPLWLNRFLGELCSLHLLSGYPGFVILHLTHHRHADDPLLDPHPNKDLSFWQYLNSLKLSLRRSFHRLYFERWGETPRTRRIWAFVKVLLPVNRVLRALFVLFLLGPIGFTFFYIPSFIANQLTYAHINYYTHAQSAASPGSVEIINMNEGWVYPLLNRILIGIYFHKNHHERPNLFNPKTSPKNA